MYTGKYAEAKLYYLYMLSDGAISYGEKKLFDSICKELKITDEDKEELVKECQELIEGQAKAVLDIIKEKLCEEKNPREGDRDKLLLNRFVFGANKKLHPSPHIIWNLVNLGYADATYSEEEKEIIEYLLNCWDIKPELYQEFKDTADTLLSMETYKEWVLTKFGKGQEREKREEEVDFEMQHLLNDVKLTIREYTL